MTIKAQDDGALDYALLRNLIARAYAEGEDNARTHGAMLALMVKDERSGRPCPGYAELRRRALVTLSGKWIVWDCAPGEYPVTSFYGPFDDEAIADEFVRTLEQEFPTHSIEAWPLIDAKEEKL